MSEMPDESERCTLCLGEKISAMSLRCGHSFCRACLKKFKTFHKFAYAVRCPLCRRRITLRTISRATPPYLRSRFHRINTADGNIAWIRSAGVLSSHSQSNSSLIAAISHESLTVRDEDGTTSATVTSAANEAEQEAEQENHEATIVTVARDQELAPDPDVEAESEFEKLSLDESEDESSDDDNGEFGVWNVDYEATIPTYAVMTIDTNSAPDDYFFYYDASDYDLNTINITITPVNDNADNNNNSDDRNANDTIEQVTSSHIIPIEAVGNVSDIMPPVDIIIDNNYVSTYEGMRFYYASSQVSEDGNEDPFNMMTPVEENNDNNNFTGNGEESFNYGSDQVSEDGSEEDSFDSANTSNTTTSAGEAVLQVDIVDIDEQISVSEDSSNDANTYNTTTSAGEAVLQVDIVGTDEQSVSEDSSMMPTSIIP